MRRCLRCKSTDSITRDHVVPRVQLKLALGKEQYEKFCSQVRKLNIMDLCGPCNNEKGDKAIDLRDEDTQLLLRIALMEYGLDPEDIFLPYEQVFDDSDIYAQELTES
jgi:hypothetical protein